MLYGEYRLICRFEDDAVLPHYKGSTFRGIFGRALKQVVCALKTRDCPDCLLKERCVYVQVFETGILADSAGKTRGMDRPHPFVIEPPDTADTHFPKGSDFEFRLLLFGKTNVHLPYFIYAFDRMSRIGIGKMINGKRPEFRLIHVMMEDRPIYSPEDKRLTVPDDLPEIDPLTGESPPGLFRLELTLQTPLRLKFENRLKADLPFHVLVRAMLRRISTLSAYYGDGDPPLDYHGLVKRAESVKIIEDRLEWFDWRRFSFRQDREMLMGGMTGSVVYEGELGEFLPLVRFCEKVHLGKQTTFGLGRIQGEVLS